ncbi:MAG: RNA polymerase sigma factor, partial [Solirubrobacteraceae bacterium]
MEGGGHIGGRDRARGFDIQSDQRLLALAREGDEHAFEMLVRRYRTPLARYCRRFSLPEARAEDVLQQSFLNAWLALRAGAEVHELRPWLYRIVHNAALNSLRAERVRGEPLALDALNGEQQGVVARRCAHGAELEDVVIARDVLASMAALPEMQREVIVRAAVRGDSYDEVAGALGLTDGAVRGLLHRARASLRAAVSGLAPPPFLLS